VTQVDDFILALVCVDTDSSMVTCWMMICLKTRFVLYDLQNNKHCVGGCRLSPSDAKVR
jgi:hypothetical protein